MDNTVCVIGLGYIGLPTASLLAAKGFDVVGVDVNKQAVEKINNGEVHIYEPDLDVLVNQTVKVGKLRAAIEPVEADVYIIAVPTPFQENNKPDLKFVESATRSIAPYVKKDSLIILESTSPVGTTEKIEKWILEERLDLKNETNLFFAYCPERVLPGKILKELIANDRIVGGLNISSTKKAAEFYRKFVNGAVLESNSRTAEMAKLTENAFRDVNIAFANELSLICDQLNVDVWELIDLANHHPRVNILSPGPGVGGHCIAVDPWFIVDASPEFSKLIRTARNVNNYKPQYVIEQIVKQAGKINNPKIACLGLAFKANIDDLRESPSVEIVKNLADLNIGDVYAVEPNIETLPKELEAKNIILVDTNQAINQADIVVFLVEHEAFKSIDKMILKDKVIIDTKGIFKELSYNENLLQV
ncbi:MULTISPECIES: UDP-N-acetyl-D-mannosamine dehydrogenase [Bacillus cereus group]|uniref:UDP-N-acetyl-D-mannosamine dehydrogenase n=1 Tax=Bacillus cereus group TaxID=86661 RepID=UPI0010FF7EDD|nr:UDP-N-acetyl-D-mannosamine dehydrogenase [Bacillus paranthracis]MCW4577937.1 UDP-N-acetyl-D-mannosamine dehydrogenase [Bacillus pacificus]QCU08439.1 UDP-N-acetyl-D-mannosamine dehydrogenase [Bacillus paranthracis]HDR7280158.1 UDP-N-acetyl-D-mannosamine dehydrogenase [Bacillus paranthracis]